VKLGSRPSIASLRPFGVGLPRERHGLAAAGAAWKSRHALRFGFDVLRYGVCGDCSLGTHGWSDDAIGGVHLCARRLRGLDRWTSEPFDVDRLPDVGALRDLPADRLRALGRVPVPLIRRAGEQRFARASWDDATKLVASRLREASRPWGILLEPSLPSNECFFLYERLARRLKTPHIDLVGGAGHRAALSVLQWTTGADAGTCSLRDLLEADLVVLWGAGFGRHPFLARLLQTARRGGTRVVAIGPDDDPEFTGVWLPGEAGSTLFGSRIVDDHLQLAPGRDRELAWALLAALTDDGADPRPLNDPRLEGWAPIRAALKRSGARPFARDAGLDPRRVALLAEQLRTARSCVVLTGPAIGRGAAGAQTAGAVVSIAALLGLLGRRGSGLLPLGGASGVRGGCDLGCTPDPSRGGWSAARQVEAARAGEMELLLAVSAGLDGLLPDDATPETALRELPVRVHHVLELDPSVLLEPGEVSIVLPAQSRFEQRGGATSTSVDRIVRYSPEILGHPVAEARPDWQAPSMIARRFDPDLREHFDPIDGAAVREQIAAEVEAYAGIDRLHAPGDGVQWGGRTLHVDRFATPSGRARIPPIEPPPPT
jgi:predicted molibdopterin-dependent oxidoreductase YjgC